VSAERPLRIEDVESLRRALAMSASLPEDQVLSVLHDHRLLLLERQELDALLRELALPLREVRALLNRLHVLLQESGPGAGPGTVVAPAGGDES
jgi:hypothetical protein